MQDGRSYFVYRHTSPSGKVYVGITSQAPTRRWAHGHGYRHNPYFLKAIQKYGWDNFTHEVLCSGLSKEAACEKEMELIRFHRSNNEEYGYNLSSGGEFPSTGITLSEETRRKLSESKRGDKSPWYGKKFSEEHRRKMRESHLGKHFWNDEQRAQISERQRGEKNHNYGKRASEETRKKQRDSHRKYNVLQVDVEGRIVAVFPSTRAAATAVGSHSGVISSVCRGERKTAAGYRWRYETIKED